MDPHPPATDNALIDAMAYVMITENLHDQAFLDKYCVGFDDEHLPAGAPPKSSYKSYVLGRPTGSPRPRSGRRQSPASAADHRPPGPEIAMTKPCALIQNLGWQRHASGEQPVRGLPVLTAMTGNIGRSGGGTGLTRSRKGAPSPSIPTGTNPVKAQIPVFMWTEAIVRGKELTAKDGVLGADKLDANIKFIWNYGGNTLINQHSDAGATHRILQDESLCEFIVVHDVMMTPSARYADLLLPDRTSYERLHLGRGSTNVMGDRFYLGVPAITPLFDAKANYEVCAGVAEKLGISDQFTEGKTMGGLVPGGHAALREKNPGFPTWEKLLEDPIVARARTRSR